MEKHPLVCKIIDPSANQRETRQNEEKSQNSSSYYTCPRHVCQTCCLRHNVDVTPKINDFENDNDHGNLISKSLDEVLSSQKNGDQVLEISQYNKLPQRLFNCLKCNASFHNDENCLPAGSLIVDKNLGLMICPLHRCNRFFNNSEKVKKSTSNSLFGPNTNFWFCCKCGVIPKEEKVSCIYDEAQGILPTRKDPNPKFNSNRCSSSEDSENSSSESDSEIIDLKNNQKKTKKLLKIQQEKLYFCEFCPRSYHENCLGNKALIENNMMICDFCISKRNYMKMNIVWVKYNDLRWWPGMVLPDLIDDDSGNFSVQLLGFDEIVPISRNEVCSFPVAEFKNHNHLNNFMLENIKFSPKKAVFLEAVALAKEYKPLLELELKEDLQKYESELLKKCSQVPPPYVKLKACKPYAKHIKLPPFDHEVINICKCHQDLENPCAPGTTCFNVMTNEECGKFCRAGERCQNKNFMNRNYPRIKLFKTDWGGWGLKIEEDLPKNRLVIEYVGEIIDEPEMWRRINATTSLASQAKDANDLKNLKSNRKSNTNSNSTTFKSTKKTNWYFMTLDNTRIIDAGPKGNLARFMNHSCDPNCKTEKWNVGGDIRVGLFSNRIIKKGEELTFNYQFENICKDKQKCFCGSKNCSGWLGNKPLSDDEIRS